MKDLFYQFECSVKTILQSITKSKSNTEPMDNFGEPMGQYSAFNTNEQNYQAKVTDLYGTARVAFIRKVYTILSIQLLITVLMTALSMTNQAFFMYQIQNTWLIWTCIILTLFIEIYIFCCDGGRTFPSNMILLGTFTFCEGYIVSFISSATGYQQGNGIVMIAALMTLAVVVACTLYAFYTDEDYTTSSALVIILSVVLLLLFIVTMFTDSPFIRNLYCAVGVLLFSIYLVIDTQMIMGGKSLELRVDEYVLAALLLYIDIIQIFLYILQLLSNNNND